MEAWSWSTCLPMWFSGIALPLSKSPLVIIDYHAAWLLLRFLSSLQSNNYITTIITNLPKSSSRFLVQAWSLSICWVIISTLALTWILKLNLKILNRIGQIQGKTDLWSKISNFLIETPSDLLLQGLPLGRLLLTKLPDFYFQFLWSYCSTAKFVFVADENYECLRTAHCCQIFLSWLLITLWMSQHWYKFVHKTTI